MTIEEAIKNIKDHCYFANLIPQAKEALDIAIKALEQEPCADCISREKVSELLNEGWWKGIYPREAIMALPSVIPQPKMGKWKAFTHSAYHGNDEDGEPIWREVTVYHCNLCNRRTVIRENYCPNCGAEMEKR